MNVIGYFWGALMLRRQFIIASTLAISTWPARAQGDTFATLLAQAAADPDSLEAANAEREKYQAFPGEALGANGSFRTRRSQRALSPRARDLLVTFEVSGQSVYERRYIHPTWPGGSSGVTIGIGYDLGYVDADTFRADWQAILDAASITALVSCCGITGQAAHDTCPAVSSVSVSWTQASTQFDNYLPYAVAQTEDTFPNCAALRDDSLGALVSLIYNRGTSLSPISDRRREMREIFALMRAQTFTDIPQEIRDMKRLWPGPNEKGLVARRELEAVLFQDGLNAV